MYLKEINSLENRTVPLTRTSNGKLSNEMQKIVISDAFYTNEAKTKVHSVNSSNLGNSYEATGHHKNGKSCNFSLTRHNKSTSGLSSRNRKIILFLSLIFYV